MLGFADNTIAAVYILCILSGLLCAVYGLINWNKDDPDDPAAAPADGAEEKK